jgi:hypothetical protein
MKANRRESEAIRVFTSHSRALASIRGWPGGSGAGGFNGGGFQSSSARMCRGYWLDRSCAIAVAAVVSLMLKSLTSEAERVFEYEHENHLTNVYVSETWRGEFKFDAHRRRRASKESNAEFE